MHPTANYCMYSHPSAEDMLQVYIAFVVLGLDPRRVEILISDLVRHPRFVLVHCLGALTFAR
eukprot:COSAG03_NODE_1424_length_4103_cov_1.379371_5_plen_62_part_00